MDEPDLDPRDKNFVGSLDRSVVNIGVVCLAIFPTFFFLIFRPKGLISVLRGDQPDGRDGLKLGPGVTFILSVLLLLVIGMLIRNTGAPDPVTDEARPSSGMRTALAEGNLWRGIILSLPLYFAAVALGLIIQTSHLILRQISDFRQCIAIGLYSMSTLLLLIIPFGISAERFAYGSPHLNAVMIAVLIGVGVILPWQIFSFSKHAFGNRNGAAALIALLSLFLALAAFTGFGFIVASFEI